MFKLQTFFHQKSLKENKRANHLGEKIFTTYVANNV